MSDQDTGYEPSACGSDELNGISHHLPGAYSYIYDLLAEYKDIISRVAEAIQKLNLEMDADYDYSDERLRDLLIGMKDQMDQHYSAVQCAGEKFSKICDDLNEISYYGFIWDYIFENYVDDKNDSITD